MTIDITIPVLNEEETLAKNVLKARDFLLANLPKDVEWKIVIADNGSTDETENIGRQLSISYPEVQLVKVPRRGVGLALKTSWSQSKADIVGYMDLDLATDLPHLLEAYDAIAHQDYDVVYGTRLHKKSKVINRTPTREFTSRVFNTILKLYVGTAISDGMCGFKFLKRKHYASIHQKGAQNDGWFFATELLVISEWLQLKMYELPVKWTDDPGNSKVNIPQLAKRYLMSMYELKKHR